MKLNLKNKKTIIISVLAIATILVATASTITLPKKIKQLMSKKTEALLAQDYLEVNRNDSPKFSVIYNDERTKATITIDYPLNATEKQYSIDGGRVWKDYGGEFILNQNVTIYARYKTESTSDYIIGSTKLIIDLKYNLELQAPIVEMNTKDESEQTIQYTGDKITKADVDLNLSHPQEDDAKIEYEAKISSYYIGTEGLIDADGKVNEAAVLAEPDNEGADFKKIGDYKGEIGYEVAEDNKQLTIKQTGIYKVTIRATSNGGFVKSEEVNVVIAIDKINRADLIMLKTADGEVYTSGKWTNQDVTAYINPDAKEAYEEFDQAQKAGNAKVIFTDNDGVESEVELENFMANGKTFTDEGKVTISFETQIGEYTLTMQQFKIFIDKTAPTVNVKAYQYSETANGSGHNSTGDVLGSVDGNTTQTLTVDWINKSVNFETVTTDSQSGFDKIVYYYNNSGEYVESGEVKWYNPNGYIYRTSSLDMGLFAEGIRRIRFVAYDKAGNTTTINGTIRIDKTAPTVKINVQGGDQINGWYQGEFGITQIVDGEERDNSEIKKVQVSLDWSDSQSGINKEMTEHSKDGKVDKIYYDLGNDKPPALTISNSKILNVKYKVYDKAGNSTPVSKTVNVCLAHSGGTATCASKAKCERCNVEYGSLGAHTESTTWTTDGTNHWKICSRCGKTIGTKTEHSGGTWIDNTAGSTHYKICAICGRGYGYAEHTYGDWGGVDPMSHSRRCSVCLHTQWGNHNFGANNNLLNCLVCNWTRK